MSVAPYPEVEQVAINLKLGQTPCIINSTENFILSVACNQKCTYKQ